MPLDVALFVEALATDIGLFAPLGCAKLILSTRASAQYLQTLSSTLRKPTSQAIFRAMLKYHAEGHDPNGVLGPTENQWQHLGMAIAGGADQDLVFAILADAEWQLPRTTDVPICSGGEQFQARCPYAFHGPCGGPLFAACDRGDVALATLLLGCQADPEDDRQVDLWTGERSRKAWACTTTLSAAVGCGKLSMVKLLLRRTETSLPDILHKPSYELHNGGVWLGKYDDGVYAYGITVLQEAICGEQPDVVELLLRRHADPTMPCSWRITLEDNGN